jgi:hypothetical protein
MYITSWRHHIGRIVIYTCVDVIVYQMLAAISRRLDAVLHPDPRDVPSVFFQKDAVSVKVEYRNGRLLCIYNQCYFMCDKLNPMPLDDAHHTAFCSLEEARVELSRVTELRSTDNGMQLRIETEFTRAPVTRAPATSFQMPALFGGRKKEELVITWKESDTFKMFPVDSSTSVEDCDSDRCAELSTVTVVLNFPDQTNPCLRLLVGNHEFRKTVYTSEEGDEIKAFLWRDGVRLSKIKISSDDAFKPCKRLYIQFEDSTHQVMGFNCMEHVIYVDKEEF